MIGQFLDIGLHRHRNAAGPVDIAHHFCCLRSRT